MCVTKELKHMVCLHTDKYKKECKHQTGSVLATLIKCTQKVQSTCQYDLCHECRRYWAKHDINEQEATRSYVSYREAHDYSGPLSPTFMFYAENSVPRERISATGESAQAVQNSAGPPTTRNNDLQDITPFLYGRSNPERRSSDASIRTEWPVSYGPRRESTQNARSQEEKGKKVIRTPSSSGQSGSQGVVFLTEDEEGPPKWI